MNRRNVMIAAAALAAASALPAAAAVEDRRPWKVYQVNDSEWHVARSTEEAGQHAAESWGYKDWADVRADALSCSDEEPEELTDAAMDGMVFCDTDENEEVIARRTFREELARRVAEGLKAPELFACSEW